jgi:hypothetical protein
MDDGKAAKRAVNMTQNLPGREAFDETRLVARVPLTGEFPSS